MKTMVFKLCDAAEWSAAIKAGSYGGSGVDRRDGYIHLSAADQLAETAAKHFRGQEELVVIAFDADKLGASLKWEVSRGGALFPHYYGELDPSLAAWVAPAPLDANGIPLLPQCVPTC